MKIRKLRIAVSVFFGLLAVALCVLWVRSYWWIDDFTMHIGKSLPNVSIGAVLGKMCIALAPPEFSAGYYCTPIDDELREYFPGHTTLGFRCFTSTRGHGAIYFPIWLPAAMTASMAWWLMQSPLRLPQFSLRTLLIVATLVAIVLGLDVWLAS